MTDNQEPWGVASLRIAADAEAVDREAFKAFVGQLGSPTGAVTLNLEDPRRIWIDECPHERTTPPSEQVSWAVDEVESVVGGTSPQDFEIDLELWIGLRVDSQLGLILDSRTVQRLSQMGVEVVLDLYGR